MKWLEFISKVNEELKKEGIEDCEINYIGFSNYGLHKDNAESPSIYFYGDEKELCIYS